MNIHGLQGSISLSVLSVFLTDKFALSQSDARISVAYNSCQWLTSFMKRCPGGISSSVLSVFFTDNCYKLLKSLHLIGWEQICQWKTLTKHLMKCPPGMLCDYVLMFLSLYFSFLMWYICQSKTFILFV